MHNTELHCSDIVALGDTHSLPVISDILRHYKIMNSIIIGVGDHGEGFGCDDCVLEELEEYLQETNNKFIAIRGNHSDPSYFKKEHKYNQKFQNIEFIEDYSIKTINDHVFLFVGGAISIDRTERKEGRDYWSDEPFVLSDTYLDLPQVDVLVTHSAPISAPPYGLTKIKYWLDRDVHLEDELITERKNIDILCQHVCPKINLYGHFHQVLSIRIDDIYYRGLNINELISITNILR